MSDIAILIQNLSKEYGLGVVGTGTLRNDFRRWWARKTGAEDPSLKIGMENKLSEAGGNYVYALRDINLEVMQGEVVGIIGKNGAGKSTLLKILSRVTTPTSGSVDMYGRVASLLEVGTGFHPELTGRENIFLNGAIMGMTKQEIKSRFNEIVDFGGVGKYMDTPVKRYSSGMYVRLAFAVAAHLEPEILVVDEVLAVGDAEFQKKAIGKMKEVSKNEGRTVLFVSHNMAAVNDLCKTAILLQNGRMIKKGETSEIIKLYQEGISNIDSERTWNELSSAPGSDKIKLRKLHLVNNNLEKINYTFVNNNIGIYIEYEVIEDTSWFTHSINLYNASGVHIFTSHDNNKNSPQEGVKKGSYSTLVNVPANLLQDGSYTLSVACISYNPFIILFHETDLLRIQIIDTKYDSSRPEDYTARLPGLIRPKLLWNERKRI